MKQRRIVKMNSFFVSNAKPKTKRSQSFETWVELSQIPSSKKIRQRRTKKRRTISSNAQRDYVVHLKDDINYPCDLVLGKFMEINWKEQLKVTKKYDHKKEAICVDGFDVKDSTEEKHLIAFENNTTSRCVFAKVSRKISRYHLNTKKIFDAYDGLLLLLWKANHTLIEGKNVTVSTMVMQSWG